MSATNRPITAREWGMLLTLSLVWGGSFFFNEIAVRQLPVFTVVVCRVGLAAVILLAVLRLTGQRLPRSGKVWAAFFGMGMLNNVIPFSLIVAGQQSVASGVASILNAATPLFGVIFAHLLTQDEKLTPLKLAGVIVGFLGVAVMIGPDAISGLGGNLAAQMMILAGAASYAFAGIFGRRFKAMGVTPMATATGQVIASSIILLPLVLVIDRPWTLPAPGWDAIAALIGVAAISTAFAYFLYFRILASAGATNLLLVTFLIPISAILLGTAFLSEALLPRQIAGMALIGLGLSLIDGRLWRRLGG